MEGACAPALAQLLQTSTHLQSLVLSNNYYFLSEPEAVQSLAVALGTNKSLTSLNLDYCSLGDSGVAVLAEQLKKNVTLKELDLEGNDLTDAGAQALLEMLVENDVLRSLELQQGNYISSANMERISAAFA